MTPTVIKSGRGPEGITVPIPRSISERIADDLTEQVRSGQLVGAPGRAVYVADPLPGWIT